MSSSVTGELVTETFDYDGGRQVTVYVPPVAPEAVVLTGDGQSISPWGTALVAGFVDRFRETVKKATTTASRTASSTALRQVRQVSTRSTTKRQMRRLRP